MEEISLLKMKKGISPLHEKCLVSMLIYYLLNHRVKGHDPHRTAYDDEDDNDTEYECHNIISRLLSLTDMHEEEQLNEELHNGRQNDRHDCR